MRTVFEQSWKLLTEDECQVFKKLSVFRGGFQREAAEQVAGATLPVLSMLVDKSLVHSEAGGRFQIHELLRQYAAEQLSASQGVETQVFDLHCDYFADFLYRRNDDLVGTRQGNAIPEITADLDNIRAMWRYATEQVRLDAFEKVATAYPQYCDIQGHYQEAVQALLKASTSLGKLTNLQARRTLAIFDVWLGWHYLRFGQYDDSQAAFNRSQAFYEEMDLSPPPASGPTH